MNVKVNYFLLAGDKFMPETHLSQPGFTYSACEPFTKNKKTKKVQNLKETGVSQCIYQNELDKAYFQSDMAYRDFKNLTRRKASDKILRGKAFNIAKNLKYDGYQRGLVSLIYKFFDKKISGGATMLTSETAVENEIMSNKELAEELHKSVIRTFKKRKVYSWFIDNIWGADHANIQSISKFNKGIHILFYRYFQ